MELPWTAEVLVPINQDSDDPTTPGGSRWWERDLV
jgi:hypothetical protein